MFTKKDYIKYFLQIKKIEVDMGDRFLGCAKKLEDPEMKTFFLQMHGEEISHSWVVDYILKIFTDK